MLIAAFLHEVKSQKSFLGIDLGIYCLPVDQELCLACAIGQEYTVMECIREAGNKGDKGGDAGTASQEYGVLCILNHQIPVWQFYPYPSAGVQFLFHTGGVIALHGIGYPQTFPMGGGTGYGENSGFGPETAWVVVVEGQVEKLAGPEARHRALGGEINGIDVIAMSGDLLHMAAYFLGGGHYCLFPCSVHELRKSAANNE